MDSKCGICLEKYTSRTRVKIVCQYCPIGACRTCQQNYLVNTYDDPHCFSCKQGWSAEFLAGAFTMTFRTKTLRQHRRKILLEREKSLLPAMQVFVEAKKNMENSYALSTELYKVAMEKKAEMDVLSNKSYQTKVKANILYAKVITGTITEEEATEYDLVKERLVRRARAVDRYYKDEYRPAFNIYTDIRRKADYWARVFETGVLGEEGGTKERREFLMRCPVEGCRGFLSTSYKCGTCEKKTCSSCLEPLTDDLEHTCVPDMVETANAIKKETRPCPKCGVRIYKIDGCDQMWCTLEGCNTAFSWDTGAIVVGRVHNPHYYEWLRRKGTAGGAIPREIGDIPCGGLPGAWEFLGHIQQNPTISAAAKDTILEIHRNVTELQEKLVRDFPQRPGAPFNKNTNVRYLMNEITEEVWMTTLEHAEAKFNRKKENGQILQTLVTAAADILQMVYQRAIESAAAETIVTETEIVARHADWIQDSSGGGAIELEAAAAAQLLYEAALNTASLHAMGEWLDKEALPDLENLRLYTNESFETLSRSTRMAVPQISATWRWVPIRAIYKRVKNEIVEAEEPPLTAAALLL